MGKAFCYIKNLFLSDSRRGLTMAITMSIMPARKQAISGMIDQKKLKGGFSKNVIFMKNSISGQSTPTAIKDAPAI